MQAIVCKYSGPTNSSGGRVLVRADAGRMVVPWDYALNTYENMEAAAIKFARKKGWSGRLIGGSLPGDMGYAFVFASGESRDRMAPRHARRRSYYR